MTACVILAACSASTEGTGTAGVPAVANSNVDAKPQAEQPRPRDVAAVFSVAAGSGGSGEVMTELKKHGGQLREPEANYDVYDTKSTADLKELGKSIQESLDRDRRVLIDSDGTPESRQKSADMAFAAIGASVNDAGAMLIRKAPQDKGGGYMLIPIYSQADVAAQVAKGSIPNPQAQSNTVDNFFFEPQKQK